MNVNMIMEMCVAYNAVLLNQPEDCRDQPKAMLAALQRLRHLALTPGYRGERSDSVVEWLDDCLDEAQTNVAVPSKLEDEK